jgi:hypothetical protein
MFALSAWILQPALEPVRPAGLRAVCARIVWPVLFASHVPGVLCGHVQRQQRTDELCQLSCPSGRVQYWLRTDNVPRRQLLGRHLQCHYRYGSLYRMFCGHLQFRQWANVMHALSARCVFFPLCIAHANLVLVMCRKTHRPIFFLSFFFSLSLVYICVPLTTVFFFPYRAIFGHWSCVDSRRVLGLSEWFLLCRVRCHRLPTVCVGNLCRTAWVLQLHGVSAGYVPGHGRRKSMCAMPERIARR